MATKNIIGLKADYGSLDDRIDDRTAFIADAQRLLTQVGEALKSSRTIHPDYSVRHLSSKVVGFAGEIIATYIEPQRRFGVSLIFSHTPGEAKTRPDGVAGYALYRRMWDNPHGTKDELAVDPRLRVEDRRPLYGTYPEGLINLVQVMLTDHPMNPEARKPLAVG